MRYICLVEPSSGFVLCLVGHASNSGDVFNEFETGLDHLEFFVAGRSELDEWASQLDEMGIDHSGVKDLGYSPNAMLTFRDPDNIQLEFFWRAPLEPSENEPPDVQISRHEADHGAAVPSEVATKTTASLPVSDTGRDAAELT